MAGNIMRYDIAAILEEARFDYLSADNRAFITAFDSEMQNRGYASQHPSGDIIGDGYCWAPYMTVYTRPDVKTKRITARIYMRDNGITLRMYFSGIDKHRAFIENTPGHIKDVFLEGYGDCRHCEIGQRAGGNCRFRKNYTIDNRTIEKCNGEVFEFWRPALEKLPDYLALYDEFYAVIRKT